MKEDLLKYMSNRSRDLSHPTTKGGPVVTISREKGCPANNIAENLAARLALETRDDDWKWVTKEIIEKAARELHVNPSKINHVIYSEDQGFFRDLIHSFGEKYYESDVAVKKSLAGLINEFATKGKAVIVGIGGVAITKNITKSFHVKLYGPQKWRLKEVMKMENMNSERARDYMEETDINRKMLIDYYNGIKADNDLFDVQYNCSKMDEDLIVSSIISMMKHKGLISAH